MSAARQLDPAALVDDRVGVVHRAASFKVSLENGDMPRIMTAFYKVVFGSFETHPVRHLTRSEIKHRIDIVTKWFRTLQGEWNWTTDRALSCLRIALAADLDGRTWEPPPEGRTLWAPDSTLIPEEKDGPR